MGPNGQILSFTARVPKPNPKKRKRENCDMERPLQQMAWEPNKRRLLDSGEALQVSASPEEWDNQIVWGSGLKPFKHNTNTATDEDITDGDATTNDNLMAMADAFRELEEAMKTYTVTETATISMVMDLDTPPSQTTQDDMGIDMESEVTEMSQENRVKRFHRESRL